MGSNICCIRREILPSDYTLTSITLQLSGPDNKPLCMTGITKIKMNSNNFNINVVNKLSSEIVLENYFFI